MPIFDVTVKGMALETKGFTEWNTFDGLGLVTQGLIWGCDNIWFGPWTSTGESISTSWVSCGSVTTNWTLVPVVPVVTVWVPFSTNNIENC